MKKPNNVVTEFGVPLNHEVRMRIFNFFGSIGWRAHEDTEFDRLIYVSPEEGMPTICYWRTDNEARVRNFTDRSVEEPSIFSKGLSLLPDIGRVTEVGLIVPSEEVPGIWERGGDILAAHAYEPLREYCGTWDFRFSDALGFSLRVTGDPEYQF